MPREKLTTTTFTKGLPKVKTHDLEEEVIVLREALGIASNRTIEEWLELPQRVRDETAARAMAAEWSNYAHAAARLGFEPFADGWTPERRKKLYRTLFQTPGCRKHLQLHNQDLEKNREPILARLQNIALLGEDAVAVRAVALIAKITGWQKTPDTAIDNRRITMMSLVSGEHDNRDMPQEVHGTVEPLALLNHEPGDPTAVIEGDYVEMREHA